MNVLVVQRTSNVADVAFSLSVSARLIEALEYLQDHGQAQYVTCPEDAPYTYELLSWADAVFFCKHHSPQALQLATAAKERGVVVLMDLDDWVLEFPAYSGAASKSSMAAGVKRILDIADVVTVSNERLLYEIRPYRADPVLVPNGIYVEKYAPKTWNNDSSQKIVFTNADFLKVRAFKEMLLAVLQDFFRDNPSFILDFYGDPFPEIHSLPFIHFTNRVPYEEYMHCLGSGEYAFSIVPLGGIEDSDSIVFHRCKNPFKYLNYATAGIPGIYSQSPIYEQCILPDATGLLVENSYDGWREALERMASATDLRRSIREASFRDVRDKYHIRFAATEYLRLLHSRKTERAIHT